MSNKKWFYLGLLCCAPFIVGLLAGIVEVMR